MVDGVETEMKTLIKIFNKVEEYIDREADTKAKDKIDAINNKVDKLNRIIDSAIYEIKDEFKIDDED